MRRMKRVCLAAAAAVAALAGCGSDDGSSTAVITEVKTSVTTETQPEATAGTTVSQAPPAAPSKQTQPRTFPVKEFTNAGETTSDLQVRIIAVELRAPDPPNLAEWGVKLKSGYRWARVRVRMENTGDKPVTQSLISYTLVTDRGRRYAGEGAPIYNGATHCCGSFTGTGRPDALAPGDVARGWIGFPIDPDALPTRLRVSSAGGDLFPPQEWTLDD